MTQTPQMPEYERGLVAQTASVKPVSKMEVNSNGTRFRNIFYLTLTGIVAIVLIFAVTVWALSFLSVSVAITVVAFAGSVVAVVGTFIGSQTGYLIGSSGKEHAEQRTDNLQSVLLKTISEYSQGSKEKPQS
jgi:ABC-type transport system involved in cytochrome bd biosynthesis fused ATPase/permease subunit